MHPSIIDDHLRSRRCCVASERDRSGVPLRYRIEKKRTDFETTTTSVRVRHVQLALVGCWPVDGNDFVEHRQTIWFPRRLACRQQSSSVHSGTTDHRWNAWNWYSGYTLVTWLSERKENQTVLEGIHPNYFECYFSARQWRTREICQGSRQWQWRFPPDSLRFEEGQSRLPEPHCRMECDRDWSEQAWRQRRWQHSSNVVIVSNSRRAVSMARACPTCDKHGLEQLCRSHRPTSRLKKIDWALRKRPNETIPKRVPINLIFIVVNAPPTVSPCVMHSAIRIHWPFSKAIAKRGTITKIDPTPIMTTLFTAVKIRGHCGVNHCLIVLRVFPFFPFRASLISWRMLRVDSIFVGLVNNRTIAPDWKTKKACARWSSDWMDVPAAKTCSMRRRRALM